jgi:SAM-dependent methyltransferase
MTVLEQSKLDELLHQMVGDMGAAAVAPLVVLGDKLGLYKKIAADGPLTTQDLADGTDTDERYVREWCSAQAGFGYIDYDAATECFAMSPEQQAVFADDGPARLTGGYYAIASMAIDEPKITEAFRTGSGVTWGNHDTCLFCGVEKFFRPGYEANLVDAWLPALDGVVEKLERGATVADVGCGHGASTIVMARAFPNSTFVGYDLHDASIARANDLAREAGLTNVRFEVAVAKEFGGAEYDLICFFDCLHDMGDPAGAAAHVRGALKPDGTLMVVEPFAHDTLEDNLNPVSRLYYCFSTMICTPTSKSQEVGLALGAQAGLERLTDVIVNGGGFASCTQAAATPFNLILEAKP